MRGLSYLAFAAGYRRVSFVLIEDGQLATWHTSKRAASDPEEAATFAQEFIELLLPNAIILEDITKGTRKGKIARSLIAAMSEQAEQANAQIVMISREKLFRTRYDEARYLIRHYPEFEEKLPKRSFWDREPHQMVLFEALALAHHAMQGGALLLARKM